MISIFSIVFYTLFLGLMVGGLFVSKRSLPSQILILIVVAIFTGATFLGMFLGSFFASFVSVILIKMLLFIISILFIFFCLSRFHTTLGFFYSNDITVWGPMILLFFFFGMEWAFYEISLWSIIMTSLAFLLAMIGGTYLQILIQDRTWRLPFSPFIPFVWLLFILIIKLL
ncbi:hypothetical protein [Bacillus alkalicellulosilyticus]|uniref:hypothetical protein n=1 Tax=Alkalihalobacterium alkalicellulosilyticum TaxID=1912214 RepID=UPI0009968AF3|nr:hypothetical protein [Bacillus alkalicellulosilyticus]